MLPVVAQGLLDLLLVVAVPGQYGLVALAAAHRGEELGRDGVAHRVGRLKRLSIVARPFGFMSGDMSGDIQNGVLWREILPLARESAVPLEALGIAGGEW